MHDDTTSLIDISVVIPCYNEKPSLQELYDRLTNVLLAHGGQYELIFVDDGSTDGSLGLLREMCSRDIRVKIIRFRKNFGKSQALNQGFKHCRGRIVITIDADLQDFPEEIPKLIAHLDSECDLVSGWKKNRSDPMFKKITSRIFNFFTSAVSGIKIHDFNCGLKIYRREVIQDLHLYGEIYRFIPVLTGWKGFNVGEIQVQHAPRRYGKSKYGYERFMRGFFDLLTITFLAKYTQRPLHLFGAVGMLFSVIGLAIDAYLAVLWFSGDYIGHRPLLMLGTLLIIIGIQFVSFGLMGELMVFSSKKENEAIVKKTYGFE